MRDMLAARVPTLLGAQISMRRRVGGLWNRGLGHKLGPPPDLLAIVGDVACFLLWMMSTRRSWNLASPLQEIG